VAVGDLTTVANVKALAQGAIAGNNLDTELGTLIGAATAFILSATDRSFGAIASVTEIRRGNGGTELFLAEGPVVAVQSLTINTRPIPQQPTDGQPGWFLVNELLCLSSYCFTKSKVRNVRVTYTAGYADVPRDVEQACGELVLAMYKRGPRIDEKSKTNEVGKITVSFDQKDVPAFVERIITKYRKVTPL
jgi:hypothetical protein